MKLRHTLRRVHLWLGWMVGVPILLWTLSGLVMALKPIDQVRGTDRRATPPTLDYPATLVPPRVAVPLTALSLEPQGGRTVWIAVFPGGARRADPATGAWLPAVTAAEARALADAAYAPDSAIASVTRTPADRPPLDLRKRRPAWSVAFADGTRVYIDADTGQTLAVRTRWWRLYDWMWGLHIMDLQERENTSHALLIGFAALAFVTTMLALILLPLASRRRKRPGVEPKEPVRESIPRRPS